MWGVVGGGGGDGGVGFYVVFPRRIKGDCFLSKPTCVVVLLDSPSQTRMGAGGGAWVSSDFFFVQGFFRANTTS